MMHMCIGLIMTSVSCVAMMVRTCLFVVDSEGQGSGLHSICMQCKGILIGTVVFFQPVCLFERAQRFYASGLTMVHIKFQLICASIGKSCAYS